MFVGKGKGKKKSQKMCMDNYFQNIFPKISGSQEDNQISNFGCLLVVVDTRTRKFCYPACPAGGRNCGHSGGRNFFFLQFWFGLVGKYCSFLEKKKSFFAKLKKKNLQSHLFLDTRPRVAKFKSKVGSRRATKI